MITVKGVESLIKNAQIKNGGKARGRVKIVKGDNVKIMRYTDPKTGKVYEIPFPEEDYTNAGNKNQVTPQFLYWYFRSLWISILSLSCPCLTQSQPTPVILVKNNGNVVAKLIPYIFINVNSCSCFAIYVIASDTSGNSYTADCLVFCNYFIITVNNSIYTPLIPFAVLQNITITKTSTSYLGITWAIVVKLNYNDPYLPYSAYVINNTPFFTYNQGNYKYIGNTGWALSPQGNTTVKDVINNAYGDYAVYPPNFPLNSPVFAHGGWYFAPVLINNIAYVIIWMPYCNSAQPVVNGLMVGKVTTLDGGQIVGISVISQTPYQAPMPSEVASVFGVVALEAET